MFLGITTEGMEELSAKEVRGKVIAPKRILFEKELKEYRSLQKVIEIVNQGKWKEMDTIVEQVAKSKLKIEDPFSVDCEREGEHEYTSADLMHAVISCLVEQGHKKEYKTPKTIISIDICDDLCTIGYLKADRLGRREYRVRINNQSVNGNIAYACVALADVQSDEIILDPFCKDGVIAIEAAKSGAKKVFAWDGNRNNIKNARINVQMAETTNVEVQERDLSWIETAFKKGEIDKVVTNAFIGKEEEKSLKRIKEMLHQVKPIVKKSITLLTNKGMKLHEVLTDFKVIQEKDIDVGQMHYSIITVVKN